MLKIIFFKIVPFIAIPLLLTACASRQYQASDFKSVEALLCEKGNDCYQNLDDTIIQYTLKENNTGIDVEGTVTIAIPAVNHLADANFRLYFLNEDKEPICTKNISVFGSLAGSKTFPFSASVCQNLADDIAYSITPSIIIYGNDAYQTSSYRTSLIH